MTGGEVFMEAWRGRDTTAVNIRHTRQADKQTAVEQTANDETGNYNAG